MSSGQLELPSESSVQGYNPAPDTPLELARSLGSDIKIEPWMISNTVGLLALYQEALRRQYPGSAMPDNVAREALMNRMPENFAEYYSESGSDVEDIISDVKDDLAHTAQINHSPSIHSEIKDLKLHSIIVIERLYDLGLIKTQNYKDIHSRVDKLMVYFYSQFDKEHGGDSMAAFTFRKANIIGIVGEIYLTPSIFLHEVIHAVIEDPYRMNSAEETKPGDGVGFWDACMPLAEATVQHIADRGLGISSDLALGGTKKAMTHRTAVDFFNTNAITAFDDQKIYRTFREIMYELCEGEVHIDDFVRALTDAEMVTELSYKLDRQFPELARYSGLFRCGVIELINRYITGEHATILCGGLENQADRAQYLLGIIKSNKVGRKHLEGLMQRLKQKQKYRTSRKDAARN